MNIKHNLSINNGQDGFRDVNGCVFNFLGVSHNKKRGKVNMGFHSVSKERD